MPFSAPTLNSLPENPLHCRSPMPHSHLTVNHLLAQVEEYRRRKAERDVRPEWLTAWINAAAELFEPTKGVGRVGFECNPTETGWDISLYLGMTEYIGGPDDGRISPASFDFNLQSLAELFEEVLSIEFEVLPEPREDEVAPPYAAIAIQGIASEQPMSVRVLAVPPENAGPGFKRLPDGTTEVNG
ncbi:hypothetical protein [Stratiformator vulcanicus]|uniref:Uncharacterized protein n=1 Tax=Stratiformator vulcanicus TaxID=2527980 RepID=A0A517R169_9PLAN|nr:hypothetical protein [Stratiformator vulcanicus]QDT37639.1 hypothetical protein Pan189_20190 [Stratiformator vulcanicus]